MTADPTCPNRSKSQRKAPRLRIVLIAAIYTVLGLGWYLGPSGPEPKLSLDNRPRAADVKPQRFVLWELHADDTARVVELITHSTESGKTYQVNGQSLLPDSQVVSLRFIGGELANQFTTEEVWRGRTFLQTQYWLNGFDDRYGYDMRIARPPHLHINGAERLISLGIEQVLCPGNHRCCHPA